MLKKLLITHFLLSINHTGKILVGIMMLTLILGYQATSLQLQISFDYLLSDNNPRIETFNQISIYNSQINADFLMVTNGLFNYYCSIDYSNQCFKFVKDFPKYMLFDIEKDPHELNNLSDQHKDLVAHGMFLIDEWIEENMYEADRGDPLQGVIREGGPHHANIYSKVWNTYVERLEKTDRKNRSMEHMMEVAKWTKKAGIEVRGSFMIALPGETPALAEQTIKDALKLDPEYAQFSVATPYPGTALYDEIKKGKWGKLTTENFTEYQGWNVVFLPDGYKNKEEVLKMSKKAFKTFYMRPSYIIKAIINIRSLEDIKRYFKGFRALVKGFV